MDYKENRNYTGNNIKSSANVSKIAKTDCRVVDGFKNWLILMVTVLCSLLVTENYMRFGIVKGPFEIAYYVLDLTMQHMWLLYAALALYSLQIAQTFLVENLLAMNLIPERIGMCLHALNVFVFPTAFTVIGRVNNANPPVMRIILSYIMYVMTKVWSYAYVNSTYREASRQKLNKVEKRGEKSIHYPNNITMTNLIGYMVFTPPVQYKISYPEKPQVNWKALGIMLVKLFLVYYFIALVALQFVLPELSVLEDKDLRYNQKIGSILRIMIFANIQWLISIYIHLQKVFLPGYAAFAGMKDFVFHNDWWNSENLGIFWRKWNLPVYQCLKHNVAIPLRKNGYSLTTINIVVYLLAGILHEYLNAFVVGLYNGSMCISTLLEIPIGHLCAYIARKFGNRYGNLFVWLYLMTIHLLAALFLFFNTRSN